MLLVRLPGGHAAASLSPGCLRLIHTRSGCSAETPEAICLHFLNFSQRFRSFMRTAPRAGSSTWERGVYFPPWMAVFRHLPRLSASWPGQTESEAHTLEGLDAINFYMREARTYGAEVASITRAIATLDHAMGGATAFAAAVHLRDSFMGVPRSR
jgi:hypothetical protein